MKRMSEKHEEKVITLLEKIAQQTKPKEDISSEPEKHEHWKAEELINPECPECKAEKQKLRSQILKEYAEETKDSNLVCEGCGIGVKKEWENCPSCGSKDAREK